MIQLFKVFIPVSVIGLVLSEFVLIFLCYLAGTALIAGLINPEFSLAIFVGNEYGLYLIAFLVTCIVAGLYFQDLYSNFKVRSLILLVQQLCLTIGFAFLLQALLTYLKLGFVSIPRWGMIFGSLLTLIVIPAWRVFYARYVSKALGAKNVLFLGTSRVIQEIAAHMVEHPEVGMRNLGYVDNGDQSRAFPGGTLLGEVSELPSLARQLRPDLIVVGMTERRQELPLNEMLHLRFSGIHFEEAMVTFEATFGRVLTTEMRPSRLIFSSDPDPARVAS